MKTLLLVTTTLEHKEDAERIATLLLERRLIACAQISAPITSIYRWNGAVNTAAEWILTLKTLPEHYALLEEVLIREHPYKIPEIIAQDIPYVSAPYSEWVEQEVS